MRKTIVLFMIIVAYRLARLEQEDSAQFIENADIFFQKYAKEGAVDYQLVKQNFREVALLYQRIGDVRLDKELTSNEKKAFYMNAYTITVIYQMAKYYPLQAPGEVIGFFSQVKHEVAGEKMTLNELERNKLARWFPDPRVRFVLANATVANPIAYRSAQLDQQLDAQARVLLNSSAIVRVNEAQKSVEVPVIFQRYEKELAQTGYSVRAYINRYRSEKIPANYRILYYDWESEPVLVPTP